MAVAVCLALGSATPLSLAQVQPDAGAVLRDQAQPRLVIPPRAAPRIEVDEPVRPAMKPSDARFVVKRFLLTHNAMIADAELQALLAETIGKEVGFAELEAAVARVTQRYRERGYLLARAYLPAQDIHDGAVEIQVLEGRYGKVEVKNAARVRDDVVRRLIERHIEPGVAAYELKLDRALLLAGDLAGVAAAHSVLRPGEKVGETDIRIELTASRLISGTVEFDNHGNRFTGPHRVSAQVNVASPLRLGDQVSLRVIKGLTGLDYARAAYQLPVGGDGARVGAAYTASRYQLYGAAFNAAGITGDSRAWTVNASYPFVRGRNVNLTGQLAYDWRDFEDRTTSTGTLSEKSTRVAAATLSGDARDGLLGGGVSAFAVTYNAGQVGIRSPAQQAADAASARTQGHFDKWSVNALRLQTLSESMQLYIALTAQRAGKNLDSSEKLILGGAQGVRAYPQGEAAGDSGIVGSAEVRYNASVDKLPGVVQPFVFVDAGRVTINTTPFAATPNRRDLAGAGAGVAWSRPNDFQVKLSVARRLGSQPATASDRDSRSRGWIYLSKQF
jgi:hemolysin activation/secretion protein